MRLRLVKIESIDQDKRTATGSYLDGTGILNNILLCGPVEELSLPRIYNEKGDEGLGEGQIGVVLFDDFERPFCIGFLEINNPAKIKKFLRPKIRPGEIYKRGPRNQELYMDTRGNFSISGGPGEGITYNVDERSLRFKSNIFNFFGMGYEVLTGIVKRLGRVILRATGIAFEYTVRLVRPVTNLNVAHFAIGDIYDENGAPILGKLEQAGALLRIFNDMGIKVSELIIDKSGNLIFVLSGDVKMEFTNKCEVSGDSMSLLVNSLKIGGETNLEKAILGDTFYRQLFLTHTHSTAVGPTSPPQMVIDEKLILSDIVQIKKNI